MNLKSILLTATATLGLTAATIAQVPNYVPTSGLLAWYPFTGNSNDVSGNGNNGTNNGATLTSDRFGNANSAYSFNGTSNYIDVNDVSSLRLNNTDYTISFWTYINAYGTGGGTAFIYKRGSGSQNGWALGGDQGTQNKLGLITSGGADPRGYSTSTLALNGWHNVTVVYTLASQELKFYIDGVLDNTTTGVDNNYNPVGGMPSPSANCTSVLRFGQDSQNNSYWLDGKLDDIGLWNHALTQSEITNLFNSCLLSITSQPNNQNLSLGSNAQFTVITSNPNTTYQWQSNPLNFGWSIIPNNQSYSGSSTSNLSVNNVNLSNHNQNFRVIATSGNCIDTSNVAVINILDTCITNITVYDTLLTTVTDTLVINAIITGINPPNNLNTLKVFPNPVSTHISIDYGNFNAMSGYTLTIINSVGQTVFTTPINQQTSYIDLSTWTGNGIYFVQLIDPQNNTIENRKIVIQ
jgi:hypothetical protein